MSTISKKNRTLLKHGTFKSTSRSRFNAWNETMGRSTLFDRTITVLTIRVKLKTNGNLHAKLKPLYE